DSPAHASHYVMSLFVHGSHHQRTLHSFPTRRSSDLHLRNRSVRERNSRAHELESVDSRRWWRNERRDWNYATSGGNAARRDQRKDRKSTRLNSSHVKISYAVFCLKKKRSRRNRRRQR